MKLGREFYTRDDTIDIARSLLGKLLVVPTADGKRVSGMIVETEAYLGVTDRAAHTYGGRRTPRNESTYFLGGHVYVFFIYGMYYQLNVVTGAVDTPHVVLVRAIEPIDGLEIMKERRGSMAEKNLTSGPGKLCIALAIDRALNGADLLGDQIWLEEFAKVEQGMIEAGPRVGIDYAGEDVDRPWRFWIRGNAYVSKKPRSKVKSSGETT